MFRPCIDLHEGRVKQIVGGSLRDDGVGLRTHFVADRPASWYAERYRQDGLAGGHVIMLGPGNEVAARSALAAYPGGLQVGGGIRPDNAAAWLDAGASHVIVTSWVFHAGRIDWGRLDELVRAVGSRRLVVDLSCRRREDQYLVVTDRYQTLTNEPLRRDLFGQLGACCAEFLVHAVDHEGLCQGIDDRLVRWLAEWSPRPATYAGGARSIADLDRVHQIGMGRIDLTIGSALDLFGGAGVRYADAVAWNRQHAPGL